MSVLSTQRLREYILFSLSLERLISQIEGKNVLVTGASSGIGAATSLLYAKAGANVVLTARRAEKLEKVVKQAKELNPRGKYEAMNLDISKREEINQFFQRTSFKAFDILVNNAGLVKGLEEVGSINDDDVDTMFDTNVIGLIKLTQIFVNHFKERNAGHVVNLGSIAGLEPYQRGSIYCSTKHAVRSFTSSLMKELVGTPIRVSEVEPGLVETEFSVVRFRGDKDKADDVYKDLDPLTPEDIAEEIIWITSRPPHVQVANTLVFPTNQASAGIVARPGKSNN